jgi:hypothetical protein
MPPHPEDSHSARICPACAGTTLPVGSPHWHLCACDLAVATSPDQNEGIIAEGRRRGRGHNVALDVEERMAVVPEARFAAEEQRAAHDALQAKLQAEDSGH